MVDEHGRSRDRRLIISGGVHIHPAEIDAVLLQHPAVAGVSASPDDDRASRCPRAPSFFGS